MTSYLQTVFSNIQDDPGNLGYYLISHCLKILVKILNKYI